MSRRRTLDLVVVGGGPAGLATAIGARLAGLSVRLFDRARPPIDKACGEGLMPDAVARLRQLGVELEGGVGGGGGASSFPFRGIRYIDGEIVAAGLFPQAGGLGVRRLVLHQALVRRAEEVGVELGWGVQVEGLDGGQDAAVRAAGETVTARFIAGADGLHSRLRRWAGLEESPPIARFPPGVAARFGVRRHFACRPWSDCVEVYWGPGCEAYVTPVAPDEVGVAMLWSGRKSRFDELLGCWPELAARLAGAAVTSRDRGAGPLRQGIAAVHRGNVALVGDAAGYLDAITGEGIAVALHQAAALVEAIVAGDLTRYAAAHRRIGRLPNAMTSLVLAFERRPAIRRRAIRALAAEPALFSRLLGIHARTLTPRHLGALGVLKLIARFAAP